MKHLLKISYFIVFATIVASVYTSCGNESELFDEPVVYQTRAMTRAGMGTEEGGREVRLAGSCSSMDIDICNGIAIANITITWKGYPDDWNDEAGATCKVTIKHGYDTNYKVKSIHKEEARIVGGIHAEAEFTVILENTQTGATITDKAHHNGFNVVKKGWLPHGSDTPIPMNINLTDSLTIHISVHQKIETVH